MTTKTISLTHRFSEVPQACQPPQPLQRFPHRPFQTNPGSRQAAGRPPSLLPAPEPRYACDLPTIPPLPFRRGEGSVVTLGFRDAKRAKWPGCSLPKGEGCDEGDQRVHPLRRHLRFSAKPDRATPLAATFLCAALCLLASPARAATNDLTTALQRGLFEEEANQNLGAAIQAYQTVANQFDKDRKLVATAIFRLGECYRKQGNTNDAATQYERILRDFSDQPTLITLSRQNLAGMGSAPATPAAPVLSDAARQEQKRLLEEEIKLVQKQLDMKQGQFRGGVIPYGEVIPTERDLLKLKRQVAALDAGLPVSISATETTAPVLSDAARQEQKRLLEEEIKLVQKDLDEKQELVQKQGFPQQGLLPIERDLLRLKRQLAALDAGLPISFAAPEAAPATSSEADEVKRIQALIKDSPDLINAPLENGMTLLQSAAQSGKLAVVKALLENGAAVDGLRQPGPTPLMFAADNGHKAVIDLLLSKGAKADAQSDNGVTALHLASRKGYEAVAKALLAAGAPVNAHGTKDVTSGRSMEVGFNIGSDRTPLHLAAIAGYPGMVELLLANGADANAEDGVGRTPLSYAVQSRYDAVARVLLAAHANPNAGRLALPLATAAFQGDMPALKLLLANGADPNTNSMVRWSVNTRGGEFPGGGKFTPLFLAVSQRKADAAKQLLRCKADPNLPGPTGNPLLYEALSDAPTLKVLLDSGADPNAGPSGGTPMLMQAVYDKNQPAVELLLAHRAEVNCTVPDGTTPLQAAAANGLKPIAELLLKAGAAVNAKGNNGETPLYAAVRTHQPELAELLLANKADPNVQNDAGGMPLHQAVSEDQPKLVKLLLASKADPNARDKFGQTPLDVAKNIAQHSRPAPGAAPGMPMQPLRAAGLPGQPPSIPTTATVQEAKPEEMTALLRRHGAADDLPRLDWIEVRRNAIRVNTTFTKGAHDWSQFTLLELIAVECDLLARWPNQEGGDSYSGPAFFNQFRVFPFPDFARLRVRRPAADLKSWKDQIVDLRPVLEAGDCSKDVRLEWGDVVDIPEADHPLNESWAGFSKTELTNLKKCLTRGVQIVVKGQATAVTLAPKITGLESGEGATQVFPYGRGGSVHWEPTIVAHTTFWLKPVLLQSELVLTSSDLRHVKVTRRDTTSGQEHVWVVDCSQPNSSPDLWLRDGDKIEVPERTDSASAE